MGVDLSIIGKHSVQFNKSELTNKYSLVEKLNSLRFENSEFLEQMCTTWNTSYKSLNNQTSRDEKVELERCLKIKKWEIIYEDVDDCWSDSTNYELEGPYGLILYLNKYYFEISIWIGRYYQWFKRKDDNHVFWRDSWRQIIYKITIALGGDYVLYFPDNNYELSKYWPRNFSFPKGMEEELHCNLKNLDHAVEAISKIYTIPITLSDADKTFERNDKAPFVVDRFEDILYEID